jgi:hypothetical protein
MKKWSLVLLVAFVIGLFPMVAQAQFKPDSGQIKGYMIAEWYYVADHHTGSDDGVKDRNGLWFRRIYLTYNNSLSDKVSMRLRLEMNSSSFGSDKLVPAVKDAYLNFKLSGGVQLRAGIFGPPIFGTLEDIWGYRSLEKTPLDLFKWTSSRDFGVSLKGGKKLKWQAMLAQGSSNKGEADNGKKLYLSLAYADKGFHAEVNGHYEARKEIYTETLIHPFLCYSGDWGRVGVEYGNINLKKKPEDGDEETYKYNVMSVFAVITLNKVDLIARYDRNWGDGYYKNWKGSKVSYVPFADYGEPSFLIAAVSWNCAKNVWLIPNIKYATYADPHEDAKINEKPGDDMYANLTLWFKF